MNTTHACHLIVTRWDGGAHPGKYHVFLIAPSEPKLGLSFCPFSAQCVVDDFGDLVAVPR